MTAIPLATAGSGEARLRRFRSITFGALLTGYMGYYLCRQNLSVAFTPMRTALGLDALAYGSITSVGTLLYAIGKFGTGSLADSRGGRAVFLLGLWGSVAASVLFGMGSGLLFFAVVWGVNRFFQSMGWAGLVQVLARWYPREQHGTVMGLMSTSYQFGGVVATLFAGLLLQLGFGFRALFFVPAAALALVGIGCHLLVKGAPQDLGLRLDGSPIEEPAQPSAAAPGGASELPVAATPAMDTSARFGLLLRQPIFLAMCLLSFVLTLLRESFNTWMPAYFADAGAGGSVAAFKSAVFPLLGCGGTLAAGWLSDRHLRGRRVPVITVSLACLTLSLFALAFLPSLSRVLAVEKDTLAVALVGVAGFFLLAPYSMVAGGVVALDLGGQGAAATAAGLLDGVGYLAAVAAGVGVASAVLRGGWTLAYSLMAWLSLGSVVVCLLLWRAEHRARAA